METSPAKRLPESDSLPDGFVEASADPLQPPPPPSDDDYKDVLFDLHLSGELANPLPPPSETGAEALALDYLVDATEKLVIPTECLTTGDSVDNCLDSVSRDGISESRLRDDGPMEVNRPQNEIVIDTSPEGSNRGDCQNSRTETKGQLEFHATNPKGSGEAKRKVAKRSTKLDKELLEFTLKYQKVMAERDAAVAVHERLESLCRELQHQNKILIDECQRVSTEGQNMRLDLSTKFNDVIKDISDKLEARKDECLSQLNENEMLRNKLELLADQYSLSEQHFAQKLEQKTLELQLADLKLQQQEEKSTEEQTQMQLYAEQISQLMITEKSLRLQLEADGERFQQFQDALSKSNEVFDAFKQEMEKMAKLIKEVKKENECLKNKCENLDIALVKLIEEREAAKQQLEKVQKQKEKLESLCRSLQAERKHNSVRPTSSLKEDS